MAMKKSSAKEKEKEDSEKQKDEELEEEPLKFPNPEEFFGPNSIRGDQNLVSVALGVEGDDVMNSWIDQYNFEIDFESEEGEEAAMPEEDSFEEAPSPRVGVDHFNLVEVNTLKEYLSSNGVDVSSCVEKADFVRELKKYSKIESEAEEKEMDPCELLENEVDFRLIKPLFAHLSTVNSSLVKQLETHAGFIFVFWLQRSKNNSTKAGREKEKVELREKKRKLREKNNNVEITFTMVY